MGMVKLSDYLYKYDSEDTIRWMERLSDKYLDIVDLYKPHPIPVAEPIDWHYENLKNHREAEIILLKLVDRNLRTNTAAALRMTDVLTKLYVSSISLERCTRLLIYLTIILIVVGAWSIVKI